ncbi:MAG: hypothetical protein AVDCRST_MAG93-4168 [uncultured Chloroflexia bacterium]|uniref:Uncharacterized protein n=1 Tax=uncultured Chloroflexia bacterium TaxID=1672391 RepID=A0A6J4K3E9_9CHLR|nr:MAG: hypothetical protein AVDCRST_MAG93-4168 [uncultured Chloroflexia bacterium]
MAAVLLRCGATYCVGCGCADIRSAGQHARFCVTMVGVLDRELFDAAKTP